MDPDQAHFESGLTTTADPAVHLAQYQRLLSLFTEGLAGCYYHLKSTESLTGGFRPQGPTFDGRTIYLPETVNQFPEPRLNLGVYRVAILHQLGYSEFGTFTFEYDVAANRFAWLPNRQRRANDRRVDLERFFEAFGQPALGKRLFALLEDFRVDCLLPIRYPGITTDLQRVMLHELTQRSRLELPDGLIPATLELLQRWTLGANANDLFAADSTGRFLPLLDFVRPLADPSADVYSTAQAAGDVYRWLARWSPQRPSHVDVESDLEATAEGNDPGGDAVPTDDQGIGGTIPLGEGDLEIVGADFRGEMQPDLVQREIRLSELTQVNDEIESLADELSPQELAQKLDEMRAWLDPPVLDADEPIDPPEKRTGSPQTSGAPRPANAEALAQLIRDEIHNRKRQIQQDESVLRRNFGELSGSTRSYLYDEWDHQRQSYLRGWCRLFEHRLQGDDFDYFREVRQRHRLLAGQIQDQLKRIRAASLERVKPVSDGDEIDLEPLLAALIDRRAGATPDENVYSRKDRARREVAAAFLLDMSASTDDVIPDPDAPEPPPLPDDPEDPYYYTYNAPSDPNPDTRRVIDVEKDSLALMSEALEVLGDAFAIYGFSGYGRDQVEFYVAKEFEEGVTRKTKAALAAMEPRRSTRMGPAIRHTIRRLEQQDVPLRVLIILSDGFPQDCDYGPDANDHEYGIQDTARALREARDRGVATFCITVDQSGHDYLRRMCPENQYLVIDEIESLPDQLSKIYRSLTV